MNKLSNSEPIIRFKNYKIHRIDYQVIDQQQYKKEFGKANVRVGLGIGSKIKEHTGIVQIKVTFGNHSDEELYRKCYLEVEAFFEVSEELKEIEKIKKYLAVNGSAMLYPYVRMIVSMITALDDSKVKLLPTLNFTDAFKEWHE